MEYLELAGNKPAKLLEFLLFARQSGFVRLGYLELGRQDPGRRMVFVHPAEGTENRVFQHVELGSHIDTELLVLLRESPAPGSIRMGYIQLESHDALHRMDVLPIPGMPEYIDVEHVELGGIKPVVYMERVFFAQRIGSVRLGYIKLGAGDDEFHAIGMLFASNLYRRSVGYLKLGSHQHVLHVS